MCVRRLSTRLSPRLKKGAARSERRSVAREQRSCAVADRNGLPVSVCVESATPHEVTLATSTLLQMVVPDAPQNLIGDNACDSGRLDAELNFYGIQLIAPHRLNARIGLRMDAGSSGIGDAGKSRGFLRRCRTFAVWSSDMNVTPRTFLGCSIWRRL
jgi:hypothetical protein